MQQYLVALFSLSMYFLFFLRSGLPIGGLLSGFDNVNLFPVSRNSYSIRTLVLRVFVPDSSN